MGSGVGVSYGALWSRGLKSRVSGVACLRVGLSTSLDPHVASVGSPASAGSLSEAVGSGLLTQRVMVE